MIYESVQNKTRIFSDLCDKNDPCREMSYKKDRRNEQYCNLLTILIVPHRLHIYTYEFSRGIGIISESEKDRVVELFLTKCVPQSLFGQEARAFQGKRWSGLVDEGRERTGCRDIVSDAYTRDRGG